MSSTISVRCRSELTVTETFSNGAAGDNTATFATGNVDETLNSGTSVPVTKHADYTFTLSSGTGTIDLSGVPGITADETVVGTNLKAQKILFTNPITNANKIVISNGASNPYRIDGATTAWSIPLAPGQSAQLNLNEAGDDVASGHKTIDLVGTGSQTLAVRIIFG